MSNTDKRIAVRVTQDQAEKLDLLKREAYYDKSYSELYRNVIEAGLKQIELKGTK